LNIEQRILNVEVKGICENIKKGAIQFIESHLFNIPSLRSREG